MGKIVTVDRPGKISIETFEEKPLKSNEVRLQILYTGISAGTQLSLYRGINPFVEKEWNDDLHIFENRNGPGSMYPAQGGWGYEEVGKVIEIGSDVKTIEPGEIIYGTWGHVSTAIISEEFALEHKLRTGLDPILGIYSQMGCIALNAVLDADIHVGETVAVFGQGVPGQIAAQMARLNGARVIVVDLSDARLEFSKKFGADIVLNSSKVDSSKRIKELTDGFGADVCIEFTGSDSALHDAIRAAAYNGRVVCASFTQGSASHLYLAEEFHSNRIQIVSSQIYGHNPSLDHRWNRLRMEKTVYDLVEKEKLDLKGLITHVIPFDDAVEAYAMLANGVDECLQVVLKIDE